MTKSEPPRIALALLERFVPESAPLAGDLVEEFERRRSGVWFWWQVLVAIATTSFKRTDEIRPLRLVDLQPVDAQRRTFMRDRWKPVNLTASPVRGIGGLGLVVLLALVSIVEPGIWRVLAGAMLVGILVGILLIAIRRSTTG